MRVVFVAAEAAPYAKAGGLGDVVGSLPKALRSLGLEVHIFVPLYRDHRPQTEPILSFSLNFAGSSRAVRIHQGFLPQSDVPVYFVDHPPYYDRPGIYGEGDQDYPDNLLRFAFLCRAALEAAEKLGIWPDIFHVHDWHTALLPVFLREKGKRAKVVLTIHNLAFQGWYPRPEWEKLGLSPESLALAGEGEWLCSLRAGLRTADIITTVSPTYAQEILADGLGLDDILRARAEEIVGILNGIDTEEWDPKQDEYIWANYSAEDLRGKAFNRRRLLFELGLSLDAPVVAMVGRLTEQKGLDLVLAGFDRLMALGINLVILGTGESRYADFLQEAEKRWPGRVRFLAIFSEVWAHRIIAGADFLLMPSRFEPCGLTQMYALRYGTIPVVRATGGLKDTVVDVEEGGNGFVFEEFTPEAMLSALARAVRLWREDRKSLLALRRKGMAGDYSWDRAAKSYQEVYAEILSR
ncbi:glycogen synthase GlgA [Candidatus Bipolaricaulota bacterium]|nr:glycogen synthase GlgA [Candidatus Bipolaricaulota bacterium]